MSQNPPGRKAKPKMSEAEAKAAREAAKEERKSGAAFVRLGTRRTKVVLKGIANLGNLASYPHDPAQGEAIVSAIRKATDALDAKFAGTKASGDDFSL